MAGQLTRRTVIQNLLLVSGALTATGGLMTNPALAQNSTVSWLDATRAVGAVFRASLEFADKKLFYVPSRRDGATTALASDLQVVLGTLLHAQAQMAQVSADEVKYLTVGFGSEQFGGLIEAVDQFRRRLAGEATPLDFAGIFREISARRIRLMNEPMSNGPEAAALLPLVFAAEFGSAARMEADSGRVRATLNPYEVWISRMRAGGDGSVMFRQQFAEMAHDGGLNEVGETHLARRLKLQNFLLGGTQESSRTADPCVIFADNVVSMSVPFDSRGGTQTSQALSNSILRYPSFHPNVLLAHSKLAPRDDAELKVRLIHFTTGGAANYPAPHYLFWPGLKDEYCYLGRSNAVLPTPQVVANAKTLPGPKEDAEARTAIVAAVHKANAARIQIALCGEALLILQEVESMIDYHRRIPFA
jgi:hypothetical protein